MDHAELLAVEVVYCAAPGLVDESALRLATGAVLEDALVASGLLLRHGELGAAIGRKDLTAGIWGHVRPLDFPLRNDDRVEVYRPLQIDPMEARRRRQKVQSATLRNPSP